MSFYKVVVPIKLCDSRKPGKSTAICEKLPGHIGPHFGRTRGGYWEVWEVNPNGEPKQ